MAENETLKQKNLNLLNESEKEKQEKQLIIEKTHQF